MKSYRFVKKVKGNELSFLTKDKSGTYATFDLAALRSMRESIGDINTALNVLSVLEAACGFRLTVEEIEYAVKDI